MKKLGVKHFGRKLDFDEMNLLMFMLFEHHRLMNKHNPKIQDPNCDWSASPEKELVDVLSGWRQVGTAGRQEIWDNTIGKCEGELHLAPKVIIPISTQMVGTTTTDSDGKIVGWRDEKNDFHTCHSVIRKFHPYALTVC